MFALMMWLSRFLTICGAVFVLGLQGPAAAQAVVESEQIRAELSAEHNTVAPGESLWVALTFDIKPGWHTYWRTPGDSGLPATLNWTLPEGVTAGPIQWPPPERLAYGDLTNFGYSNKVTMLTELKVDAAAPPADAVLKAEGMWLVCAEICIPEDGSFTLPIKIAPGGARMSTAAGAAIAAARAKLPQPAPWPVSFSRNSKTLTLTAGPDVSADQAANVAFFPDAEGVIANAAPQTAALRNNALQLAMTPGTAAPADITGVLVLGSGEERVGYTVAAAVTGSAADAGSALAASAVTTSLLVALVLAFLGGIILNVMPCVLPVLVMKAMSFISRGTTDAAALRRDGLAYTAGVMVTFGALVGLLLALRAAGDAIGWGFQLQSPIFVAALAYVMLALGLNLSGVFNIGGTFGVGQDLAARGGATGSFFTGMLAVVVATPCTAPFMGTAIGFALTQSPLEAILIFEALALGLAAPYLLLSFVPGAARKLPRPGVWMDRVKQVLAFPLYAAAAWLLWVLAQQLDAAALASALAGLVLVGFVGWLYGTAQKSSGKGRGVALTTAGLALAATVALTATLSARPAADAQAAGPSADLSEPYSEARLAALRAEGRPVFVNFTAAWCITCKVNERLALSKADVEAAFKRGNVAYLKGDWTNRNAEISAALQAVGRDGVPLYLYYAPQAAAPVILPQMLTPSTVIEAVGGG
jgi:thiol:disulfide interchange protein